MRITYDPDKRIKTLAERQLDFDNAPEVFAGPNYQYPDNRQDYGEIRIIAVGYLHGRMVVVVFTDRPDSRHIISMRKANDREQSRYSGALDRPG